MDEVGNIPSVPFEIAFRDLAVLIWQRFGIDINHPASPYSFKVRPVRGRRAFLVIGWMRGARTIEEVQHSLAAAYFGEVTDVMIEAYSVDPANMGWAGFPQMVRDCPRRGLEPQRQAGRLS